MTRILDFFRAHLARVIAVGLILIMLIGLGFALTTRSKRASSSTYTKLVTPPAVSIMRNPASMVASAPADMTAGGAGFKPLPSFHVHVELPADATPTPLTTYAPAGRLIECQLVNTVDSGNLDTPIIALVVADLWHDGKVVVPVGAEVHGMASVDPMRERIVAKGDWTIVWQTGEELVVKGIALDREANEQGGVWGLTDGSAGLRGQIIRSSSVAEIKLFLATALSGVASSLQEPQLTRFNLPFSVTARNAGLAGTSQVLNSYAQQILETVKKEGIFVRVPAGKQMYLYVPHTIDCSQAKIGNLRVVARPAELSSPKPSRSIKP